MGSMKEDVQDHRSYLAALQRGTRYMLWHCRQAESLCIGRTPQRFDFSKDLEIAASHLFGRGDCPACCPLRGLSSEEVAFLEAFRPFSILAHYERVLKIRSITIYLNDGGDLAWIGNPLELLCERLSARRLNAISLRIALIDAEMFGHEMAPALSPQRVPCVKVVK